MKEILYTVSAPNKPITFFQFLNSSGHNYLQIQYKANPYIAMLRSELMRELAVPLIFLCMLSQRVFATHAGSSAKAAKDSHTQRTKTCILNITSHTTNKPCLILSPETF